MFGETFTQKPAIASQLSNHHRIWQGEMSKYHNRSKHWRFTRETPTAKRNPIRNCALDENENTLHLYYFLDQTQSSTTHTPPLLFPLALSLRWLSLSPHT